MCYEMMPHRFPCIILCSVLVISVMMIEHSVLHLFECYDTMAKRFKVKMGFYESEKGFWDTKGFEALLCEFSHSVIL